MFAPALATPKTLDDGRADPAADPAADAVALRPGEKGVFSLAGATDILESIHDAFYAVDWEWRFTYVNHKAEQLWGKRREDVIGKRIWDVFPEAVGGKAHQELLRAAQERRTIEFEALCPVLGNWVLEKVYPGEAGLSVCLMDVTERKRLEAELNQRVEQLAQADRRKDEFLAVLAHELRNPLAPVRNAVEVMRLRDVDDPGLRWARDVIDRQVQQMTRLVDDLLDVSRITRGKIKLQKEPVDLAAVVARAVEISRPLIDARRQELAVTLPPDPVRLDADAVRLAQVVANLLNNAAKYTDHGGRIGLSAKQEGGELVLRVRDTGVGIAADMLGRIFEPFVQSDRVLHHSQGGLGIGLTLVRSLVEMHGGSVTAHSDGPGKGSEFIVRLPALSPKQPLPGARAAGEGSEPVEAAPQRRILVVDDNVDAAESLALLLRMEGHDVRVAHDGPAALAAVEADPPDLVFLDIGMPVMNGYDVAQRLRQRPGLEHLLLVAMTGWGQEEDRRRSHEAGFDHHLVKPADPDALRQLLARPR